MNIDYILIEANKIKLGGYDVVPLRFLTDVVEYFYNMYPEKGNRLLNRYVGMSTRGYIELKSLCTDFPYKKNYLATCEENGLLRYACLQANTNQMYAELVFILLICGVADSRSILEYFKDISAVTSRVNVKVNNWDETSVKNASVISSLWVTGGFYTKLMGIFVENTSKGISYGFNVYDYVFHIIKTYSKKWEKIIKILGRFEVRDWSVFMPTSVKFLSKYREEITCMLPYILGNVSLEDKVIVRLLALAEPKLQQAVLSNSVFQQKTYKSCITEM